MLHFREAGQGTPLVLLHAFPLSSDLWQPQMEVLSAEFRVIAPDLPGFGLSSGFVGTPTVEAAAAAVHELLQELEIYSCVLGGLSMGGYVSLAFARLYPEMLRGLILCDTRAEADTSDARANRDRLIGLAESEGAAPVVEGMLPRLLGATTHSERPDIVATVRAMALRQHPESIANALRALRDRPDRRELLPEIKAPTLVVVGDEDVLTPPEAAQTLADYIPGAQIVVIPRAGHLSNIEQPEPFNAALREFVAAV